MRDYRIKVNTKWLERKRDSLLKRLAKVKPFVDGSIVKVRRRCGNKNCKCAKSTYRHEKTQKAIIRRHVREKRRKKARG